MTTELFFSRWLDSTFGFTTTNTIPFQKREIEMQQKIELEEESCLELKQVFANLQQEVEFKRDRLKRLHSKLQSIKQDMNDNHEEYLRERQELVEGNDEASL